jgi:hypothetical protein
LLVKQFQPQDLKQFKNQGGVKPRPLTPTKDKTMTDFNDWYGQDSFFAMPDELAALKRAYEAGAASQTGTLRDEFAGKALMGFCTDYTGRAEHADSIIYLVVPHIYRIADAMLEARKTTGEGE